MLIVRYTDFVCEKESSPIAVALVMNCDLIPKYKQAISKDTKGIVSGGVSHAALGVKRLLHHTALALLFATLGPCHL